MTRRTRLVGTLWRWHRRLGLLVALFVLAVCVTGIFLNHTVRLGLDQAFVDGNWLKQFYGDDSGLLPAYPLGNRWVSRAANGVVYVDSLEVSPCRGALVGALQSSGLILAACAEELLLISTSGELVESVSAGTGLPTPLQALGEIDGAIVLQVQGEWRSADIDRMVFSEAAPAGTRVSQQVSAPLPALIREAIPLPDQWLTWERVLTGRAQWSPVLVVSVSSGLIWWRCFYACWQSGGTAMWVLAPTAQRFQPRDSGGCERLSLPCLIANTRQVVNFFS